MGSGISIQMSVTGISDIIERMAQKQIDAQVSMLKAVQSLALLFERICKDEYVPVITGRLKSSIGGQSAPAPQQPGDAFYKESPVGDEITILVGSNVVYAAVVEFGRNPSSHPSHAVRSSYAADVSATTKGKSKATGNGRHGPYMRPALSKTMEVGMPVVRAQLAGDLGLL